MIPAPVWGRWRWVTAPATSTMHPARCCPSSPARRTASDSEGRSGTVDPTSVPGRKGCHWPARAEGCASAPAAHAPSRRPTPRHSRAPAIASFSMSEELTCARRARSAWLVNAPSRRAATMRSAAAPRPRTCERPMRTARSLSTSRGTTPRVGSDCARPSRYASPVCAPSMRCTLASTRESLTDGPTTRTPCLRASCTRVAGE